MTNDEHREPSAEELEEAAALRAALEGESPSGAVAETLRTVEGIRASAGLSEPLSAEARQKAVAFAIDGAGRSVRRRRAVAVVLAVAASVILGLGALLSGVGSQESVELPEQAFARATDELFDGPFSEDQTAADRVDRILEARTRGYFVAMVAER